VSRRRSPKESTIVRSILDDLRSRGRSVWFRKVHGGPFGASGVPDIEVVFRPKIEKPPSAEGFDRKMEEIFSGPRPLGPAIVVFLEAKKPGEVPTALQTATMAAIEKAGAYVRVVHSKAEALTFLETLGIPPRMEKTKDAVQPARR